MRNYNIRNNVAVGIIFGLTTLYPLASTISHAQDSKPQQAAASEWDIWSVADDSSTVSIDHTPMTNILRAVSVRDRGQDLIAYVAIKDDALDYVNAYFAYLEGIPVSKLNRNEQLAYWLNLHNVGVIKLLSESSNGHRRVKKYRGQPGEPGSEWSDRSFTVEGRALSLEDIEQNILFRHWKDPLIIYGLCYGVQGSPAIGQVAFTGPSVKKQLEQNAREFINASENVKVSSRGVQVSSLYTWNEDVLFGGSDEAILDHLQQYADAKLSAELSSANSIYKDKFSWRSTAYIPRQPSLGGFGGGGGGGVGVGS